MEFKNEKITILYGSQTGNAQDVAERIWRESKRYHFLSSVKPMDDYNISLLIYEKCVIFVCSTTGQGEEPDNMKAFWKFLLRKNLPSNSLSSLKFAVLGLGDSSYIKFNFAAKRLNKRLIQLGAQMLLPLGLADDQHDLGYDATVDPWMESLWVSILSMYPLPVGVPPLDSNTKLEPRWSISTVMGKCLKKTNQSIYYSTRTPKEFFVTVKDIIRTTAVSHFQDVRLIKLQTNGEKYSPGDVVVFRPKNMPALVEEFHEVLKSNGVDISPDTHLTVVAKNAETPVPRVLQQEVSFQQLCEGYFDLSAVPRRYVFSILSQLTDSELEREKCIEFTTAEGQDDLYSYVTRPHRNIVEVLQDFPHATKNITPEVLFEILSPIKPRDFSIASSCKAHKNELHILVAVVKYKTKLVKERFGVCSNYLADLKIGDELSVWFKKGSFCFPKKSDASVIMVGPGTGLAPFRNFICERAEEGTASSKNLLLFFGCRGKNNDFHCKEDFLKLEEEKKLQLMCAFSRDQNNKIYVQHKIIEHGALVWRYLKNKDAYIFVAGNSKNMPRSVREAFVDVCIEHGTMAKDVADGFIEQMEKCGQYQTETWS